MPPIHSPQEHAIQRYVKGDFRPIFTPEDCPRLAYVSRVEPKQNGFPRILHSHADLTEVLLVTDGAGKFMIGDTYYDVKAGNLIIYNSKVVHDEVSHLDNPVGAYCVGLSLLRIPGLREDTLIPDDAVPVFDVENEMPELRNLYAMIYDYLIREIPDYETVTNYLMLALLTRILQIIGAAPAQKRPELSEPGFLGHRIQEYMDAHYAEPLTLQSMGKALHLSPYYLAHVFKETSGYSPNQYLLRRRIGEAQNLLISTDLPISRIAEQVGYDTQNYFNMQFSKHVGMTPTKSRQTFVGTLQTPGKKGKKDT